MSNSKSQQRRLLNLMKINPHCNWCKKKLEYYQEIRFYKKSHKGKRIPHNFATIDHLNSRNRFFKRPVTPFATVLACPQCNVNRAHIEQKTRIWLTRWKAGTFPFPLRWLGNLLQHIRKTKRK